MDMTVLAIELYQLRLKVFEIDPESRGTERWLTGPDGKAVVISCEIGVEANRALRRPAKVNSCEMEPRKDI
jgi:hypothetical protein